MAGEQPRRTRDADRSRQSILDAAERLFARFGYRGTSLQDIGEAAGVSRGTPSYFFRSKEGVYRAVLERNFQTVASALRSARARSNSSGASPEEALRAQIDEYVDFLVAHPTFVRLVQWEALTGGAVLGEFAPSVALAGEALESVRQAVGARNGGGMDPMHLMISILSMCWFPLTHKDTVMRAMGIDPLDARFVADRKRHMAELVLRGLREG